MMIWYDTTARGDNGHKKQCHVPNLHEHNLSRKALEQYYHQSNSHLYSGQYNASRNEISET